MANTPTQYYTCNPANHLPVIATTRRLYYTSWCFFHRLSWNKTMSDSLKEKFLDTTVFCFTWTNETVGNETLARVREIERKEGSSEREYVLKSHASCMSKTNNERNWIQRRMKSRSWMWKCSALVGTPILYCKVFGVSHSIELMITL